MEFRLTYDGPLRASNVGERDARKSRKEHKHALRRAFHFQLRRLWEETPFLKAGGGGGPDLLSAERDYVKPAITIEELAKAHAHFGFHFVPIVTKQLGLICALDILYLRKSKPGRVLQNRGDIDNRLKTLFDALAIPDAQQGYSDMVPSEDEKPLFVLAENDELITKVSVETDLLLQDVMHDEPDKENDARLVITVRVRPYALNVDNMHLG